MSEDATPHFHLCVGVSVHGRDNGSALPELNIPICRRPNLAGTHAALHACTISSGPAHPHLHPSGPGQRQTPGPAPAHPAARTHCQVSGVLFTCIWGFFSLANQKNLLMLFLLMILHSFTVTDRCMVAFYTHMAATWIYTVFMHVNIISSLCGSFDGCTAHMFVVVIFRRP